LSIALPAVSQMRSTLDKYTRPDLNSAALVIIDAQCDFLDGQLLEIPGTSAVLPNIKLLLDAFRGHKKPVIHVVRIYRRDASNVDPCRKAAVEGGKPLLLEGSSGCQIAPGLLLSSKATLDFPLLLAGGIQYLSPSEVVIYKPRWGAFYGTPLNKYLKELGVSTLVFAGCNFPNCPRTSLYEASERDYRVVVATDAISGLYELGKNELRNIGVELLATRALLRDTERSQDCRRCESLVQSYPNRLAYWAHCRRIGRERPWTIDG
jgi:nicotinamidase-related amidase